MAPAPTSRRIRLIIDVRIRHDDPTCQKALERVLATAHRQLREKLSEYGLEIETRFEESE